MFDRVDPRFKFNQKTTTYWVIFCKAPSIIKYFLKKDFGHVCVLTHDKYNWYIMDPAKTKWRINILAYTLEQDVPNILKNQSTAMLRVDLYERDWARQHKYFGITTCVSNAMYAMGIKLWTFTPYGLYKKLLKLSHLPLKPCGIQSIKSVR